MNGIMNLVSASFIFNFCISLSFGNIIGREGRIDLKRERYLSSLQDACNETRPIEDDGILYLLTINGKGNSHGPIQPHENRWGHSGYTINTDFTETPRKTNKKTAIQAEFQKPHHLHVVRFNAEGYEHDLFTMAWLNPESHQWHAIISDGKVRVFTYGQGAIVGERTRVLRFYPEDWKGKDAWLPQPTYYECV